MESWNADPIAQLSQISVSDHPYEYDLFVIGGGSGGISAARWAAELGKKVALADFVKPTPIGTSWGLGGTCVNVGCIPKKLMHYAGLLGEAKEDQEAAGISISKEPHDWGKMVASVQKHVKSLNWGYKTDLIKLKVKYFNFYATFQDAHTLHLDNGKTQQTVTADKIIIAVGGRPQYPGIPGDKEYGITSDDIFSLKKSPGKTLVVGASYVALECGGFLNGLGYDTTVMVRSILLRGFDQDMANRIGDYMEGSGVKFIRGSVPTKLEKPGDRILVTYKDSETGEDKQDEYDTVLFAIGRYALTKDIHPERAGIHVESNGKIIAQENEQTNVSNIYAIGDVLHGKLELTPTAIKAGKLLSERLFSGATELMDYHMVPTTVFTPLEYGCCGYTEEEAQQKWGAENVTVYHTEFKPLEWAYNKKRPQVNSYVKLIVLKNENERVVGFHLCSPNAGEVTQGVSIAINMGVTKKQWDKTVGIHPTVAEDIIGLRFNKEDNPDAAKGGC